MFNERFPKNPICRKCLREFGGKIQGRSNISRGKGAGQKYISEDKQVDIVGSAINNPQQCTVRIAGQCDVRTTTMKKIKSLQIDDITSTE